MAVPGRHAPPPGLAESELFAVDAYRTDVDARVLEVDAEGSRVRLDRTVFYPGGGGQPCDVGVLDDGNRKVPVTGVRRERGVIWHHLDTADLPEPGTVLHGRIDWRRRFQLMRTHTALHVLCGVIWADHGIPVTGGTMEPMKGRLDFGFDSMSAELGKTIERRINDEIAKAHEVVVDFLPRSLADTDPALIRTAATLIPQELDPLRVIDIVGLDRQADGGTHVLSTAEVGRVRVVGTESKGRRNKRIRIEVVDPPEPDSPTTQDSAGSHG